MCVCVGGGGAQRSETVESHRAGGAGSCEPPGTGMGSRSLTAARTASALNR